MLLRLEMSETGKIAYCETFLCQRKDSRERQRDKIKTEDTEVLRRMNSAIHSGRRGKGERVNGDLNARSSLKLDNSRIPSKFPREKMLRW